MQWADGGRAECGVSCEIPVCGCGDHHVRDATRAGNVPRKQSQLPVRERGECGWGESS